MTFAFEDFPPGHFGSFGPRRVTRGEIIAFAAEFDPQPMHLDEAAAKQSLLHGLAGSGWHMCALTMRIMVDGFIQDSLSLGGLGVDEARWLAPLRPDDELTADVHVLEARPLKSRADAGMVRFRIDLFNASRQQLMSLVLACLMGRRVVSGEGTSQ